MKKVLSIILAILTICYGSGIASYAMCDMPSVEINKKTLKKVIKGENGIIQNSRKRKVIIIRFNDIGNLNKELLKKVKQAYSDFVTAQNSKIDPHLLQQTFFHFISILSKLSESINQPSFKNTRGMLSEEETRDAIIKGQQKAKSVGNLLYFGGGAAGAIGGGLGGALVGSSLAPALVVVGTVAGALMGSVALAEGAFVGGGALYNHVIARNRIDNTRVTVEQHKDLYLDIQDAVLNYKWIDKNVLAIAVSTVPKCLLSKYKFLKIDGIKYLETQEVINLDFAKLRCVFLEQDNNECLQDSLKMINCLWANLKNPAPCYKIPSNKTNDIILRKP